MAIVSLATVFNAYGSEGLGVGALYMGVITILYNVLWSSPYHVPPKKRTAYLCKAKSILVKIIKTH